MVSKHIFRVSAFLLGITLQATGITAFDIVDSVTTAGYSNHLAHLYTHIGESRGFTDGPSPRVPAYQHDLARDYMVSNFTAWGYDTWLDPFEFDVNFSYDDDSNTYHYAGCNNVVATKWGNGGTNTYLLIAHYDSVDSGHRNLTIGPGADDGASGVAALLEIAEAIKDYTFKDTIVFLACDAEEKDYQGSIYFRDNHITDNPVETNSTAFLKSSILAVVNLDSIAYDHTNTPYNVVMGRVSGFSQAAFAVGASIEKYTDLNVVASSGYNSSDHISFYNIGLDAIHVIEYDFVNYWNATNFVKNPYYHTDYDAIDSPDYLNLDYAADVTRGVAGAVCDYAIPIFPATLNQSISNNTFSISWLTSPDIEYEVYGTDNLTSNAWNLVSRIDATNDVVDQTIQFNLNTATATMFRVLSR
ncbi:M28 family metallopeptidase [Pontiella agarivorans]|uniref:M20/M25/M40 family metallo-hydrolase n=1 Tax=Pontiella agarivorans TaxID=3038953 RepID=A0ABU5MVY5_9BACT|nr:M20/M25/M40 family metallo-hydrolase [Pontiella agarivorans]MDZ8118375.1 M20/M25/M40 family metallo-hydrolase [Pontiella agarivorans]